jgi:hypothetical protein
MADYSVEIAALEAILNSATRSVSVGDLSTQIDLSAARQRLSELKAKDDAAIAGGQVRPRNATIRLNFE